MMRKRGKFAMAASAFATAVVCFAFPAFAQTVKLQSGIEFEVPEGYTALTADNLNENSETVSALGYGVKEFQSKMGEKGVVLLAVDTLNGRQAQLQAAQTEFSRDVVDLDGLSDEEIQTVGEKILRDPFSIVEVNGWLFFEVFPSERGESTACVQYITFKSGVLYTFNIYGSDKNEAAALVSALNIPAGKAEKNRFAGMTVLLWIVISVAVVTVIAVSISVVNEILGDERNDVRRYIRIRRGRGKKAGINHFFR